MDELDLVPHESIEDDLELKMHILGSQEVWTQSLSFFFVLGFFLLSLATFCEFVLVRIVDSNWVSDPSKLPIRYMPPGNLRILFTEYSGNVSPLCLFSWKSTS